MVDVLPDYPTSCRADRGRVFPETLIPSNNGDHTSRRESVGSQYRGLALGVTDTERCNIHDFLPYTYPMIFLDRLDGLVKKH